MESDPANRSKNVQFTLNVEEAHNPCNWCPRPVHPSTPSPSLCRGPRRSHRPHNDRLGRLQRHSSPEERGVPGSSPCGELAAWTRPSCRLRSSSSAFSCSSLRRSSVNAAPSGVTSPGLEKKPPIRDEDSHGICFPNVSRATAFRTSFKTRSIGRPGARMVSSRWPV